MLKRSQVAGMGLIYRYYSFDYMLSDLTKRGFQAFELYGAYPHPFLLGGVSYPEWDIVRKKIEAAGLRLVCYTPDQIKYPYNIASSDKTIRELSIQYFKDAIVGTAQLGTDKMLVTSGWGLYDENIEDAWKRSEDSLGLLANYAESIGINLLLENLNPMESNLVYDLKGIQRLREAVRSPSLKVMVDTVPMHLAGETMQDYFNAFGDDLMHVHVVDGNPIGHLAWGKGVLPLDKDIQTLVDNRYRHALTFEIENGDVIHPGDEESHSLKMIQPYLSDV